MSNEDAWVNEIECASVTDFESILSAPAVNGSDWQTNGQNPSLADSAWESDDDLSQFFQRPGTSTPQRARAHSFRLHRSLRNSHLLGPPRYRHRPATSFEQYLSDYDASTASTNSHDEQMPSTNADEKSSPRPPATTGRTTVYRNARRRVGQDPPPSSSSTHSTLRRARSLVSVRPGWKPPVTDKLFSILNARNSRLLQSRDMNNDERAKSRQLLEAAFKAYRKKTREAPIAFTSSGLRQHNNSNSNSSTNNRKNNFNDKINNNISNKIINNNNTEKNNSNTDNDNKPLKSIDMNIVPKEKRIQRGVGWIRSRSKSALSSLPKEIPPSKSDKNEDGLYPLLSRHKDKVITFRQGLATHR